MCLYFTNKHSQTSDAKFSGKLQTLQCVSHGLNSFSVDDTLAPAKGRAWQQAWQTANLWRANARQWHGHPITMETGSWLGGRQYHRHGEKHTGERKKDKKKEDTKRKQRYWKGPWELHEKGFSSCLTPLNSLFWKLSINLTPLSLIVISKHTAVSVTYDTCFKFVNLCVISPENAKKQLLWAAKKNCGQKFPTVSVCFCSFYVTLEDFLTEPCNVQLEH